MKRKIAIIVFSRANYARVKSVLEAIDQNNKLELQLIVGASALLYRYGKVVDIIEKDNFTNYVQAHDSITSKYKKYTSQWWKKRLQAFNFLKEILNLHKINHFKSVTSKFRAWHMCNFYSINIWLFNWIFRSDKTRG